MSAKKKAASRRKKPEKPTEPESREDQLVQDVVSLYNKQIQPHLKLIGLAVAVVIVAILGLASVRSSQVAHLKEGFGALREAESESELQSIIEAYADTPVAERATLELGHLQYDSAEYDKAAEQFASFLEAYPNSGLRSQARMGRAYALEAAGNKREAEELFVEIAVSVSGTAESAEAYLGAGRCAQARGDTDGARKHYEDAVSVGAGGMYETKALDRLKEIKPAEEAETETEAGGGEAEEETEK